MATRREALVGGLSFGGLAAGGQGPGTTATNGPSRAGGTNGGGSGSSGGTDAHDSGTDPHDSGTPTRCTSNIASDELVLCLDDYPSLQNPNGSSVLNNTSQGKLIVVRLTESEAVTVSDVCTHAG